MGQVLAKGRYRLSMDDSRTARLNPPLHGPGLHLEPLAPRHAEAMFAAIGDPVLYEHIDHGPPASAEHLRGVYRQLQARGPADGSEIWLNWVLFGTGADPLGFVQASVQPDGRAWVAYVLAQRAWGRGHATEALTAMLRHLFGALQVRQAMACVEQGNERSLGLLRRVGFRRGVGVELDGHALTETEQLWVLEASCLSPRA